MNSPSLTRLINNVYTAVLVGVGVFSMGWQAIPVYLLGAFIGAFPGMWREWHE